MKVGNKRLTREVETMSMHSVHFFSVHEEPEENTLQEDNLMQNNRRQFQVKET